MINIEFGPLKRHRVWVDESPPESTLVRSRADMLTLSVPTYADASRSMDVGVESFIVTGPQRHYVLLGGGFSPGNEGVLKVSTPYFRRPGSSIDSGLLLSGYGDRASAGLLRSDAEIVCEAAKVLFPRIDGLPGGELTITHAVAPESTATPWLMAAATLVLGSLLCRVPENEVAEIETVIKNALSRGYEFGGNWSPPLSE